MCRLTVSSLRLFTFAAFFCFAAPLLAQSDAPAGLFCEARPLPLVAQSLEVRITGAEAEIVLVQVFVNDGVGAAQADFRLHLPTGATVVGFGFWRGERFLAAELKEKEASRQAHGAAAAAGRATGLLEREGSMHTFSVYPLAEGSLQQVEITFRLPVAVESGRSSLRLPLDTFLGQAPASSTVLVHLETGEPLADFGLDAGAFELLAREERRATFAFTTREAAELWWAEELPPILTRAEAVDLGDGSFAVQVRVALNEVEGWDQAGRELVLIVDASFSMRRRSTAISLLLERVLGSAKGPVRLVAVGERAIEIGAGHPEELLEVLFGGGAGAGSTYEELQANAAALGCGQGAVRCLVVTDPQLPGLHAEREDGLDWLFLADADELAFFSRELGLEAATYQPGVEPRAKLLSLVDELVLPTLEVTALEQRGGTFELAGAGRRKVALGSQLRLAGETHSTEPLELQLTVAEKEQIVVVPLTVLDPESLAGEAVRRRLFATRLERWMADYQLNREPELRQQIVEVSLREGIPTPFTSLHVADPDAVLPSTGTAAPLLRLLGLALLVAGWLVVLRNRRLA